MLVSFKISNFLSFNKEQSFSMVPSLDYESNKSINEIGRVRLLKMGIILGANSSGKSNLLKALAVGANLITNTSPIKYRNYFCKIERENQNKETVFEYSFYTNGMFYTYGFSINLFSGKFLTEYLYYHDVEIDQEKVVFERVSEDNTLENLFTYIVDENPNTKKKLSKYIKDFNNSSDSLFITKINLDRSLKIRDFNNVYDYFKNNVKIYFQNIDFKIFDMSFVEYSEEVNELLRYFDTGISEVKSEEVKLEYLEEKDKDAWNSLLSYIDSRKEVGDFSFSLRVKQDLYCIHYNEGNISLYKILLKHYGADLAFEFFEESDGIRRLFDLFDLLLVPKKNSIYLFDELSRSLHPLLIIKFIKTFKRKLEDFPLQLIYTTHEANILKEELIRKDEVWFVSKGKDNASKLYSLDIFKLTNKKIFDSYLDGNYGAVPIFIRDED